MIRSLTPILTILTLSGCAFLPREVAGEYRPYGSVDSHECLILRPDGYAFYGSDDSDEMIAGTWEEGIGRVTVTFFLQDTGTDFFVIDSKGSRSLVLESQNHGFRSKKFVLVGKPNKPPLPTPASDTPAASAPVAPPSRAAGL
jgi:hypothetical protein